MDERLRQAHESAKRDFLRLFPKAFKDGHIWSAREVIRWRLTRSL